MSIQSNHHQHTMTTDYRSLCADLLEAFEIQLDELASANRLCKRVRAALAQPEPVEPTDDELLELMPETMRDEFSYATKVCSDATGGQVKPGIFRVTLNTSALEYARAVLARYGRPAIAPIPLSERAPEEGVTDDRDPECVQRWPECEDGAYDPRCCRFPKNCSCGPRSVRHSLPTPQQDPENK
jgi:hypothetical protein